MQTSENIQEVVGALLAAQAEFEVLSKSSNNPFFNSKYVALPDLVKAVNPVLAKHGLGVAQLVSNVDGSDALTTTLFHSSGQFISSTAMLHLVKNDPQAHGSAITYMRRYAYMSILGLVADEDDDGNAASISGGQRTPAKSYTKPSGGTNQGTSSGSGKPASEQMTRAVWAISHKGLNWDDSQMYDFLDEQTGRKINELSDLTFDEAKAVIDALKTLQEG